MNVYLVTGGAGFISSNFIKYMLEKQDGNKIVCLDKLTYAGNFINLEEGLINNLDRIDFIKGDISNKELVDYIYENWNIKYVINFAAESHVDRSIDNADVF